MLRIISLVSFIYFVFATIFALAGAKKYVCTTGTSKWSTSFTFSMQPTLDERGKVTRMKDLSGNKVMTEPVFGFMSMTQDQKSIFFTSDDGNYEIDLKKQEENLNKKNKKKKTIGWNGHLYVREKASMPITCSEQ